MSARNRISPCVWAGRTRALPGGLFLLCHVHARREGLAAIAAAPHLKRLEAEAPQTIYRWHKQLRQLSWGAECCDCSECFKLG